MITGAAFALTLVAVVLDAFRFAPGLAFSQQHGAQRTASEHERYDEPNTSADCHKGGAR